MLIILCRQTVARLTFQHQRAAASSSLTERPFGGFHPPLDRLRATGSDLVSDLEGGIEDRGGVLEDLGGGAVATGGRKRHRP